VASYRAYILDEHGKIVSGEDVEAADDATAIAAGQALLDADNSGRGYGFEVWRGSEVIFSGRHRPE
jgi:uncharacterized protein YuzE